MITTEIRKVSPHVGMRSCVGFLTTLPYPRSGGNYFSLWQSNLRVLNFWAENMKAAEQFLDDQQVQVRVWTWDIQDSTDGRAGQCCIIDDPRIPIEWYNNKLCYTGFGLPPKEVARQIFEVVGDPGNEFERYTDPEMYHAKRGQRYIEGGGVSMTSGVTAEMLIAELEKARSTANQGPHHVLLPFVESLKDAGAEYYLEFGDGFGFRMAHRPFTMLRLYSWRTYSFYQAKWTKNKVDGRLDMPAPVDAPLLTYADLLEKGYLVLSGFDPKDSMCPAHLKYDINTKVLDLRVTERSKSLEAGRDDATLVDPTP